MTEPTQVTVPVPATLTPFRSGTGAAGGYRTVRGVRADLGPVEATAPSRAEARTALAAGIADFLTRWEPPRLVTYGQRAILLYPTAAGVGQATYDTTTGRVLVTGHSGDTNMYEATRDAHRSLVWAATDWTDGASLRTSWAATDPVHRAEFRRYAAWQAAATAAAAAMEPDVHGWASRHDTDFLPAVDAVLAADPNAPEGTQA